MKTLNVWKVILDNQKFILVIGSDYTQGSTLVSLLLGRTLEEVMESGKGAAWSKRDGMLSAWDHPSCSINHLESWESLLFQTNLGNWSPWNKLVPLLSDDTLLLEAEKRKWEGGKLPASVEGLGVTPSVCSLWNKALKRQFSIERGAAWRVGKWLWAPGLCC